MHVDIRIIGPQGCGKTQLAQDLLRFLSDRLKNGETAYCASGNIPDKRGDEREWNIGERPYVGT